MTKKIKLELTGDQGAGKSLLLRAIKIWLGELELSYEDGGEHDISIVLTDDDLQFLHEAS